MTQRYRSQIQSTAPAVNLLIETTPSGSVSSKTTIGLPNALTRTMKDDVVPNFKKRSAAGEVLINDFDSTHKTYIGNDTYRAEYSQPDYHAIRTISAGGYLVSGGIDWASCPMPTLDESIRNQAMIQCLGNVNKTEADAGAFMGEWGKTKSLHRDVLNSLYKLMTQHASVKTKRARTRRVPVYDERGLPLFTKRGKPVYKFIHEEGSTSFKSSNASKNLANTYLAVRMGILPLLSELEGALKALCSGNPKRLTARGMVSTQAQTNGTSSISVGDGSYDLVISITRTLDIRFGILYQTDSISRLAAQFGLTRPLSSAWELLPWSFVADWLVDVGGWLDAIQPAAFTQTLGAWESTRETIVKTVTVTAHRKTYVANPGVSYDCNLSGGSVETTILKSRRRWEPAAPTLPSLGTGLTSLRSLDLAALMLQRLKTRF